jgi:hypothetical protein
VGKVSKPKKKRNWVGVGVQGENKVLEKKQRSEGKRTGKGVGKK